MQNARSGTQQRFRDSMSRARYKPRHLPVRCIEQTSVTTDWHRFQGRNLSMRRVSSIIALVLAMALLAPTVTAQDASPQASPIMGECLSPEIPDGTPTPPEASP